MRLGFQYFSVFLNLEINLNRFRKVNISSFKIIWAYINGLKFISLRLLNSTVWEQIVQITRNNDQINL